MIPENPVPGQWIPSPPAAGEINKGAEPVKISVQALKALFLRDSSDLAHFKADVFDDKLGCDERIDRHGTGKLRNKDEIRMMRDRRRNLILRWK